jgi:hypothetical protein
MAKKEVSAPDPQSIPIALNNLSIKEVFEFWPLKKAAIFLNIEYTVLTQIVKKNETWQRGCVKRGETIFISPLLLMDVYRELSKVSFPAAWGGRKAA